MIRRLLARVLGPECAHPHLAAAAVARAIEMEGL